MQRILVYGDSNSWGYLADGSGFRHARRWPIVFAEAFGPVDLIEDCLPGRTTAHDDPEMGGATFNGLAHLEACLLAHAPLDIVLIALGTNDFKMRFAPSADKIAANLRRLADSAGASMAGPGGWREGGPPRVGVIVPPQLPDNVNDPEWERAAEWATGHRVSRELAGAVARHCPGIPVFDASTAAAGSWRDPIHFEPEVHEVLGRAVSAWVRQDLC